MALDVALVIALSKLGIEAGKGLVAVVKGISQGRQQDAVDEAQDALDSAIEALSKVDEAYDNNALSDLIAGATKAKHFLDKNEGPVVEGLELAEKALGDIMEFVGGSSDKEFKRRNSAAIDRLRKSLGVAVLLLAVLIPMGCAKTYTRTYIETHPEGTYESVELPFGATNAVISTDEKGFVHAVYQVPEGAELNHSIEVPW